MSAIIQLPGWGGGGGGGGTHFASNLGRGDRPVCNGRRGCFCDVFTNGSIVSDTNFEEPFPPPSPPSFHSYNLILHRASVPV